MFSVYQPWDPLQSCIVGRAYPPEFFSWVKNTRARTALEKVAEESEEDFQLIVKKLQQFGVEVLRPNLPTETFFIDRYVRPPITPRDYIGIIGNTLYESVSFNWPLFYNNVKDPQWPECNSFEQFAQLPKLIQDECYDLHKLATWQQTHDCYNEILDYVRQQGNQIKSHVIWEHQLCNRAMCWPIGQDLIFGTWSAKHITSWADFTFEKQKQFIDQEFPYTSNHIIDTQGHADSSFCPVVPGLILSLDDLDLGKKFSDWEIVYLEHGEEFKNSVFQNIQKTRNKYYIPGFENDQNLVEVIENQLQNWTGDSAETVFDIGILNIDEKNILTFGTHEPTLNLLEKRGITVHQIPFRNRWFWDGSVHCVTCDLNRIGTQQNYNIGRTL